MGAEAVSFIVRVQIFTTSAHSHTNMKPVMVKMSQFVKNIVSTNCVLVQVQLMAHFNV